MKSLTLATLLTVAAFTAPAQSAALSGHFQTIVAANKPVFAAAAAEDPDGVCKDVKGYLDNAETKADQHAGTPAAAKWSKLADNFWDDGVALGCGWAQ